NTSARAKRSTTSTRHTRTSHPPRLSPALRLAPASKTKASASVKRSVTCARVYIGISQPKPPPYELRLAPVFKSLLLFKPTSKCGQFSGHIGFSTSGLLVLFKAFAWHRFLFCFHGKADTLAFFIYFSDRYHHLL